MVSNLVPSADTSLPSTVPVVAIFCDPKSGLILVPAIAADVLISSLTIVPFTMFALATVISVGNAPLPNFAIVTASFFILDVSIASAFISYDCIRLGTCSSCALYKSCVVLLFKSAAFTDEPGVNSAFAASTLVSRYIRTTPLDGTWFAPPEPLLSIKTTVPPPLVV